MPNLHLFATGFDLEVPKNYHYQDDGLVENPLAHSLELCRRYSGLINFSTLSLTMERLVHYAARTFFDHPQILSPRSGYCFDYHGSHSSIAEALRANQDVYVHTYVRAGMSEDNTLFCRGHEETHALIGLERLDLLKEALTRIKVNPEGLEQLPEEVICHLGGFYSLSELRVPRNYSTKPFVRIGTLQEMLVLKQWLEQHSRYKIQLLEKTT